MRLDFRVAGFVLALGLAATPAFAEDPIKIGVIAPFSGPAAEFGPGWIAGMEVYLKQHDGMLGGHKVELVKRDLPAPDPSKTKFLAQELVVKEGVQYLAGLVYTPDALAVAPIATQAHIPTVMMNAATSSLIDLSQYFLRIGYTEPQVAAPAALYAAQQGLKRMVTIVPDYAPGWDAEKTFAAVFKQSGGEIVGQIRYPLVTNDFAPYIGRIKALNPQAIFGFVPGGGPALGFHTAYGNSGLRAAGIQYIGQAETDEIDLPSYGPFIEGIVTSNFYAGGHKSAVNEAMTKTLHDLDPKAIVSQFTAVGWDAAYVIAKMIEATGGQKDGDKAIAAARGLSWESPRGPVKIDPTTRDWIQNVYIRRVDKDPATGKLYNKEFEVFPQQPDFGRKGTPVPTLASDPPQAMP